MSLFDILRKRSKFTRNVITVVTGTAIAQAIPLAISPILTRIYTPDDFGILALYLSVTSVLSVIATGRYEFAITLPPKDEDAVQILWLSCSIPVIFSVFLFCIIYFFSYEISELLGNDEIRYWLYFVPLTVLFSALYQSFNYWFNRKKSYRQISQSRVLQTSSTSAVNIGLGWIPKGGPLGLILGNILGQFFAAVYMLFLFLKSSQPIKVKKPKIMALAKRYKDFPKYDVFASFSNISSNQISHVFFVAFFGAVTSGYFYLVQKIFKAPTALIAASIQEVFKMEMVELHLANGNTRKLYLKTIKKLVILAIIPSILIYFFAVDLFRIVFGNEWEVAGEFAKIMTPVFFLRFISFPLSYMFYVREKQSYNTAGQVLQLIAVIAVFFIGKRFDAHFTVILLSITYSLFYLIYLYITFNLTSKGTKN